MKKLILAAFALCCAAAASAQAPQLVHTEDAWYVNRFPPRTVNTRLKEMPLVKVVGNHFETPDGKTILFRGIAISDPDKVARQGYWNKAHFERIKALGANIVRVPIHPVAWRERTPAGYLALLDQCVEWCTDLKMYVMLDWHTIGNHETEMYQDPMYITTQQETYDFWRKIAARFTGNNTVAFYELFNEPTDYRGQLGQISWSDWKKSVENMITIIRYSDTETIPIVGGFDWAYDLTPLRLEPINAEGIAYSTHPYANKSPQPWDATWEQNFGFAADRWPVFATEFSHDSPRRPVLVDPSKGNVPENYKLIDPSKGLVRGNYEMAPAEPIDLDGDHYGNQIIKYLEGKGISWTIWVYDPEWGGGKIQSWNYEPTEGLKFFEQAMKGNLKVQQK